MFNREDVLIPFNTSPLPSGPWVVFAPHADDETFGMGGTLLKAKDQGIDTHLVVLTDGSKGGDGQDIVKTRIDEAKKASNILGFKSLTFWDEPDRHLDASESLVTRASDLIFELEPACVFFPGPLEIHPDHRAAALLVWNALQKTRDWGKGVQPYSYEIGVQNPINTLVNTTDVTSAKERVMSIYSSQNKENNYPELVLALNKGRTFSLAAEVKFAEGFFQYKLTDLDSTFDEITHRIVDLYQRIPSSP